MNDIMIEHVIELQQKLDKEDISVIIGGGMSLYMRQTCLKRKPSTRYPFSLQTRSTEDIDVFLGGSLIINHNKIDHLKNILSELGYHPSEDALYFQFVKNINLAGSQQTIKIDLLAAFPEDKDLSLVKINQPRIKPKKSTHIHAYLTKEAHKIDYGKTPVILEGSHKNPVTTYLPSCYNYLILKLHALDDRKDRNDLKSQYGRHHALDIFTTICQMDETDWNTAKSHYKEDQEKAYLKQACQIRKDLFSTKSDKGMIRLKENQYYQDNKNIFNQYEDLFLQDMKDLFPI
jgi:hypothetical protein